MVAASLERSLASVATVDESTFDLRASSAVRWQSGRQQAKRTVLQSPSVKQTTYCGPTSTQTRTQTCTGTRRYVASNDIACGNLNEDNREDVVVSGARVDIYFSYEESLELYSIDEGEIDIEIADFDQDGDTDFAIISTFPDYENNPDYSMVYLENLNAAAYEFQNHSFEEANLSRWFLLDVGDVDLDGDTDIILSAFTYVFTPVPPAISAGWEKNNADIMVLENTLFDKD